MGCPLGDNGFVLEGFAAAAARLDRGIYGVYVVGGPAVGWRGGGSIGPGRGGGGGNERTGDGLWGIVGVEGGDRSEGVELPDTGLVTAEDEGDPFVGKRSG